MLTLTDITRIIEQELQKVVSNINKAGSIIIFVDAGISTNCSIPVSIHLHLSPPLNNKVAQNFQSQTDLHKKTEGSLTEKFLKTKKEERSYTNA
jgi:hypothetical protein